MSWYFCLILCCEERWLREGINLAVDRRDIGLTENFDEYAAKWEHEENLSFSTVVLNAFIRNSKRKWYFVESKKYFYESNILKTFMLEK